MNDQDNTYQQPYTKNSITCRICQKELLSKEHVSGFSAVCGTPEDWLEELKATSTVRQTIDWWNRVNQILWKKVEYSHLVKQYIRKLAIVSGKEWLAGDKPFPKEVAGMSKVYASKI